MGCPVCGKSSSVRKAINSAFKKQDIKDLLEKMKQQRVTKNISLARGTDIDKINESAQQ